MKKVIIILIVIAAIGCNNGERPPKDKVVHDTVWIVKPCP